MSLIAATGAQGPAIIWNLIRYVLILATAAFLAYVLDAMSHERYQSQRWYEYGITAGIVLNLVYLVFGARRRPASGASRPPGRFSRLVGLWLDAKEAELRRRAGK
jgi:hypothetical protein